jgi:stage V sporulation protein G
MQISRIRIFPFDTTSSGKQIRAFAEIEFDSQILVRGFKVIESKNGGLFISNPSIKSSKGEFKEIFTLTDSDFAHHLREAIIEAFHSHQNSFNNNHVEEETP